jgi:hypothetical protein
MPHPAPPPNWWCTFDIIINIMKHWMLPCVHLHIDGEKAWLLACRKNKHVLWERLCFIFTWFPMCSHYVLFKFPSGSQYLPQIPNVFLNMFSIASHFYPICFGKCCPPFTGIRGPKGTNFILQNKTFYFGEPP